MDWCDLPAVQGTLKKIFESEYRQVSPGVEHAVPKTQRPSTLCVPFLVERVEEGCKVQWFVLCFCTDPESTALDHWIANIC